MYSIWFSRKQNLDETVISSFSDERTVSVQLKNGPEITFPCLLLLSPQPPAYGNMWSVPSSDKSYGCWEWCSQEGGRQGPAAPSLSTRAQCLWWEPWQPCFFHWCSTFRAQADPLPLCLSLQGVSGSHAWVETHRGHRPAGKAVTEAWASTCCASAASPVPKATVWEEERVLPQHRGPQDGCGGAGLCAL